MKTKLRLKTVILYSTALAFSPMLAGAANVSLLASDPINTSSLTSAGKWSDGQAPSPANDYFTGPYFIRTPGGTAGTTYTFQGHSLTLSTPVAGGARSIIFKGGNNDVIVIDNLTNAFGGILENGGSGAQTVTYTGNRFTIAGNSAVVANQGPLIVGYPLAGAEGVILTNSGGNATGITYNNDNSAFKGKFYISTVNFGNGGGNTTVTLGAANSAPGNPSVFTPDQIRLEGGCTLRDNFGLTLNNPNSGITLAGNATISSAVTTILGEPVTDNGGAFSLTIGGTGIVVLNNANNTYSGGTIVAAGATLRAGGANVIPTGAATVNGTLDINGISTTVNSLSGSGSVDSFAAGTPTLTVGANNASGTFSGTIQNSAGTLSIMKIGTGTQTLGGIGHSGSTVAAGGTLNINTASGLVPSTPGDLIVSNAAVLVVDDSTGFSAMTANNILVDDNSTLIVNPSSSANGINANGTVTLKNNTTLKFNYGSLAANPTTFALNAAGGISTPGANITVSVEGFGFTIPATFTVIKYTGAAPANLANFSLVLPAGVVGTLVNNTVNQSIDVSITSAPRSLSWYGAASAIWDLAAVNWKIGGVDTAYQQGGIPTAGDGVVFDDTSFNDFVNPQPTNITLTTTFYPVKLTVDSTFPYSFGGAGVIAGTTSLIKSNSGSLNLNTANSYSGGTFIYGGSVIVNGDSALGSAGAGVTLNGGTLAFAGNTTSTRPVSVTSASSIGVAAGVTAQLDGPISASAGLTKLSNGTLALTASNSINGALFANAGTLNVSSGTLRFTGNPSYVAYLSGTATLNVSGNSTLNSLGELRVGGSDQNGPDFNANGVLNMSGGNAYLNALTIARGNNNQNSCAGEVNLSGGMMISTNDVLIGFAGTGKGTLRISGTGTLQVGTTATKWLRFGQWDSTSGEIDVTGGNLNLNQGSSIKFNQNNSSGPKTFVQDGGSVTFYSDYATTIGGGGNLDLMLTGTAAATNTYNLNGGTLTVPQVASSGNTGTRIFNFNGGTLRPTAGSASFFNLGTGSAVANVRNGGAIIDTRGFNVTIVQPLVHSTIPGDNATDGGLTKNGAGTLTLSGAGTYNGNTAVNAGTLQVTTASALGAAAVADGAVLSIVQSGSATKTVGNLTLNGTATAPGATIGLAVTAANNPTVAVVNCGTLTLSGNNTVSLAGAVQVGTIALIKATGAIAGSGTLTNLALPQGVQGTISTSFDGTFTTISAVITSTGPGLVWTGTTGNVWDINNRTNWLINATPTTYQQTIVPGDAVTFNDVGSGTVLLSNSVGPAALVISNESKAYTFSGSGNITGPTGLKKLGSGTATLNLTNNTYSGDTVVSNGTLRLGSATAIPAGGNVVLGSSGTMELAGLSLTLGELSGSGTLDNNSGQNPILTFGTSSGSTWNGNILFHGGGGVELHKVGSGTWVVGGTNHLDGGQPFSEQCLFTSGSVVIANGGFLSVSELQLQIANGGGNTASVVVNGGTLAVTNNVLSVGYGDTNANGTLTVNSGTVFHGGPSGGAFATVGLNCIDIGAQGATGNLIVNGGQVLNNSPLILGDGATANGTLRLNGGLVQATVVRPNNTPVSSIVYFNGGTLQATTNSADFVLSTAMIQNGGAVLDDGGFAVHIAALGLQDDPNSTGGTLVKKGAGTVYLDAANSFTGTTIVTNGKLAGIGYISGPVVVATTGNLGAGGELGVGNLNLSSVPLTLHGQATLRIDKTGGVATSDQISGFSSVNYGGTLVITNATSDGTPLASGDTFTLFNGSAPTGTFSSIVGSPGTGLAYSFNSSSGVLSVITSTVATNPTNITATVSGNTLKLSWPADHLGWTLQTNAVGIAAANAWFPYPGSASVTNLDIPINQAGTNVFFRMVYP